MKKGTKSTRGENKMAIIFDEIAHTYTDDRTGERLPSVNEIVNAVYGSGVEFVNKELLQKKSVRGTDIHKEIDGFIKTCGGSSITYPETRAFIEYATINKLPILKKATKSEEIIFVPGKFAGTADLICDGYLWDYKTSINKPTRKMLEHWQKTESMYYFALKSNGFTPKGINILHLSGGKCTKYRLEYLGDQFVLETLQAFKEGRKIEPKRETSLQTINKRAITRLSNTIKKIAELEKSIEPIREQIKQEMEKRGILSLYIGDVSISYVAPHKAKRFDTKRFKAENECLFAQYATEVEVDGYIRIK